METNVFLLLGSNIGDRLENLWKAHDLTAHIGHITNKSTVYKTAAWGKTDQPDFYNQVLQLQTELPAGGLLNEIMQIETRMGRTRTERWAARIIDIDILYFGSQVVHETDLIIPHPAIADRRFTLLPLVEIAPHFVHPILNKTNSQLLADCKDDLKVERMNAGLS